MISLRDAAAKLRGLAAEFDQFQAKLTLPVQEISLQEARDRIKAVAGDNYFSISMELNFRRDANVEQTWKVYTSGIHRDGPTLAVAVNALLAYFGPKPPEPVAEAQAILDQVTDDFLAPASN